jgi:hypothetical protein|tara:strand:- start:345 stop:809 length:465 start_codon:yes stop_codon:yes gene_type:complete
MKRTKAAGYFLIVSILVFSCSEKKVEQLPEFLIAEDTLMNVLKDIHLLEGYIARNPKKSRSTDTLYQKGYQEIFNRYNIDEVRFKKTYKYYVLKPKELELMYDQIIEDLTTAQAALQSVDKLSDSSSVKADPKLPKKFRKDNNQKNASQNQQQE